MPNLVITNVNYISIVTLIIYFYLFWRKILFPFFGAPLRGSSVLKTETFFGSKIEPKKKGAKVVISTPPVAAKVVINTSSSC